MTEKTESATPRRRGEAREKGQVLKSQDLDAVVALAGGLAFLLLAGPLVGRGLVGRMEGSLAQIGRLGGGRELVPAPDLLFNSDILLPLIAFLAGIVVVVASVQFAQVGLHLATEPFTPNLEKFSPLSGLKRIFSTRKLVQLATALVKITIVATFVAFAVREMRESPVFSRPVADRELASFLLAALWAVGWRALLALAAVAAADWFYQRWQFEKDLRMSKQEIKDEHKQTEGSPEVRNKIRARGRALVLKGMRRMLEDMQDATIVITNPTHYAVALRYVRGETPAPVVLARGMDNNALRIRERAFQLGIQVVENPPVARGLYKHTRVGHPIPSLYYQAVAIILGRLLQRGLRPTLGIPVLDSTPAPPPPRRRLF